MRALVTGCAGFVGSHLTESLLTDGHEVVGVDCFNDNYARRQKLDNLAGPYQWETFEFVPIDLSRGELEDLVDECDVIFHLAAEPGVRSSWGGRFEQYLRNNLLATQRLLETAKAADGDKRVVYASSSSVYGHAESLPTREDALPQPFSPYGVTKLAAEEMCSLYWGNHALETVSLRFFTVYGPRQRPDMAFNRFCKAALDDTPITVFGDGEQTRDFTYVLDIVSALRAAAVVPEAAGRVYNVGGGSRVSVNDALMLLSGYAGRELNVTYLDNEKGDVRDTGADTTRARAELGYLPQMRVADGLLAEFEWLESLQAAAPRRRRSLRRAPVALLPVAEAR
jgi:nucleoside-diphosphate-sugar epimerase